MIEKITKISSPLSIFLMFGVIIELGITALFPFLSPDERAIFLYFILIFPVLLLVTFIGLIVFRSSSLYGPSDFRTDEAYLQALSGKRITVNEIGVETRSKDQTTPIMDAAFSPMNLREFVEKLGDPIKMMFDIQKKLNSHLREDAFQAGVIEFHGKIWYLTFHIEESAVLQPKKGKLRHTVKTSRIIEVNPQSEIKFLLVDTNQLSKDMAGLVKLIANDIWLHFEQVIDPAKKKRFEP